MPNEIYNFLKQNNLTTKDEKTFLEEYSDPAKAQELYTFFRENNLTQKDSAQFYDTYLKKKDTTYQENSFQKLFNLYGNFKKETPSLLPSQNSVELKPLPGLTVDQTKDVLFDEAKKIDYSINTGNKPNVFQASKDVFIPILPGVAEYQIVEPYLKKAIGGINIGVGELIKMVGNMIALPEKMSMKVYRSVLGDKKVNDIMEKTNKISNKIGLGNVYDIKNEKEAELINPIEDFGEWIISNNEKLAESGADNLVGDIVQGLGQIAPDLATAAAMPAVKIPQLVKYGITHIPQFPILLGTKKVFTEGDEMPSAEGVKRFAQGWLEGTAYEALGISSNVIGKAASKTPLAQNIVATLSNATLFGGYDAAQQLITTGKIDKEQIAESIGIALGLSGRSLINSIAQSKEIRNEAEKNKAATLMTSSKEQLKNIASNKVDISELRQKSIQLDVEIDKEENAEIKAQKTLVRNVIDNTINLNAKVNDIVNFPEEHIKSVVESKEFTDVEKDYVIDKINKVLETNDPVNIEASRLAEQIAPIRAQVKMVKDSDLPQEVKDAKISGLEAQEGEIQKNINDLYKQPTYWVDGKQVSSVDKMLNLAQSEYAQTGNLPRFKVNNDLEGRDKLVQGVEDIINGKIDESKIPDQAAESESAEAKTDQAGEGAKNKKAEKEQLVKEIDASIEEMRKEYPNEFKKDGSPKAKSKLLPSFRALKDMRESTIDELFDIKNKKDASRQEAMESEFAKRGREESKLSEEETANINADFEARQKELEKYIPEEELYQEKKGEEAQRLLLEAENRDLTDKEVEFINTEFYLPKEFKYNNKGELVKEVKAKEVQDATQERKVEKDDLSEYSGTLQGQQEEGKGEREQRQEAITETDTGDRILSEQKEKVEKEQAFAVIDEIRGSFKVPEKQKEAQEKLIQYINENAPRFKHVSPSLIKHLTKEVAKITDKNVDKKIDYITKIINNSEFATKIDEVNSERKKIDINRIKNEASKYNWVKEAVFSKRFRNKGKELAVWLNNIELSELGINTDVVDGYHEALKGLNRRGVPDFTPLKDFAIKYRDVVQKSIDQNSVELPATEFTADNILNKASELTATIDELLKGENVQAQDIINAKRKSGQIISALKTLVENGDVRIEGEDFFIQNKEIAKLKDFLNNVKKFAGKTKEKLQQAEDQFKRKALSDVGEFIKKEQLQNSAITEEDARLITSIQKLSELDNLKMLSVYDVDYLKLGVEQLKESGVLPTKLYELEEKLGSAKVYSEIKPVMDKVITQRKDSKLTKKFMKLTPEKQLTEFLVSPSWDKGSIQELVEVIGKTKYDPYYDKVLSPIREEIVKIEEERNRIQKEIDDLVLKTFERGAIKKAWGYLFGVNDRNIQAKVSSARIGILMANLRFYHWINGMRPIIQEGDKFKLVDINGERIKENDKEVEFASVEEAKQWVQENKTKIIGEDNLDFYNLVTEGLHKNKGKNAKLGDVITTKEKKAIFNKAYETLTKGKEKIVVTSDEEALYRLLPVEKDLYKKFRELYENNFDRLSAVAAREGRSLAKEPYYYPMFSRSSSETSDRAEFLKEDIFQKDFSKGMPEVIGSIHPKTNAINFVDFDAYRVMRSWVNDLAISDRLLPVIRKQIRALDQTLKDYKEDKELTKEEKDELAQYIRNVKEDIKTGVIAEYTNSRMFGEVGHNRFFNTGKLLSETASFGKKILVSTATRIIRDAVPNTINFGVFTVGKGSKIGKEAGYWDDFFNYQTGTLASKKREEFVNKMAMGTYENRSIQKGLIPELTEKNIAIGDKITSGAAWIAKFEQAYKDLTGKEFNVEKYVNEEEYREKVDVDERFISARRMADREIERTLVPQTSFSNKVLLGRMLAGYEPAKKGGGLWNWSVPLSMFAMNQSKRLFSDFRDIRYNTNQGRANAIYDASKLLAGEIAYNMVSQLAWASSLYVAARLTKDEDKEKKAYETYANTFTDRKSYLYSLIGSGGALITGGYGNLARTLLGLGAVTMKQLILESKTAPERHQLEHELEEYNKLVSRMINTKVGFMSENMTFSDFITIGLPVTGYGLSKIGEGFRYGVVEPIKAATEGEDINWVQALNGMHSIFALRNTLPISKEIDQITSSIMKDFGDSQLPKEMLKIHLTYSFFNKLNSEAKEVFERAEGNEMGSGYNMLNKYLENDRGNFRKHFVYYNVNKGVFRLIEKAYTSINKSKTIKGEDKSKIIQKLKEEATLLQEHYDEYEKGKKEIEYNPKYLVEIYEKLEEDYVKSMEEKEENSFFNVVKGKVLLDELEK